MQSEQDLLLSSSLPMLHSKNNGMWKIRLRGLLDDLDLLEYVDGTYLSSSSHTSSSKKSSLEGGGEGKKKGEEVKKELRITKGRTGRRGTRFYDTSVTT